MLESILEYERNLFLWLNGGHTLYWDHFFWMYSGKMVWIPLALFVLWIICYKRPWKESLLILLFIALTITLCDQFASSVCKPLFTRFRPTRHPDFMDHVQTVINPLTGNPYLGGRYGFISSHAANAFGFATFTMLLFRYRWYTYGIMLWAILMSYTRIYLGVHFISDIIPGILSGCFFGWFCFEIYRVIRTRTIKRVGEAPLLLYEASHVRYILYAMLATIVFMLVYSGLGVPSWR